MYMATTGTLHSPTSAALPGGSNGCSPTYRLALADTCSSVAAAFNTTTARLQELNPGLDCMGLVPGQPLCMGTSGKRRGEQAYGWGEARAHRAQAFVG